jgi:beta-lactamase class A
MEFLVELIATDQLVDKASSAEMRALLSQTEDDSKLLRPIPTSVRVEHKSGWYPGVANDVGVVYAPRGTYVIAVLTSGTDSDDAGDLLIGDLSRLVYRAWGA